MLRNYAINVYIAQWNMADNLSDEERIKQLFRELDVNNDGRIDVEELTEYLNKQGIPSVPGQAEVIDSKSSLLPDRHCMNA